MTGMLRIKRQRILCLSSESSQSVSKSSGAMHEYVSSTSVTGSNWDMWCQVAGDILWSRCRIARKPFDLHNA